MAKKLDIAALMGAAGSNLDTMQVREISLEYIDENPENSYSQQGIDDLAESIQVVGLQQPLVVQRQENGRYLLIAGHRRRNALALLGRMSAPCIVLESDLDPSIRTLILHWTNTMSRGGSGLTGASLNMARKEITEALTDLKQRGVIELPGKLREYVADVLQVSESQLARSKAISDHLSKEWKGDYKCNRINDAVAYELSQCEERLQIKLHEAYKGKEWMLDAKGVKAHKKASAAAKAPLTCPELSHVVRPCVGTDKRAAAVARGECPGCCHSCDKAEAGCDWVCGNVSKRIRAHAEADEQKQKSQKQEEAFRASEAGKVYSHVLQTLNSLGYSRENLPQITTSIWTLRNLWQSTWHNLSMPSISQLSEIADAIGISLKELLFGTDETERETYSTLPAALWHPYPAERPDDGQVVLVCRKGVDGCSYRALRFNQGEWFLLELPACKMNVDVRWWSPHLAPTEGGGSNAE